MNLINSIESNRKIARKKDRSSKSELGQFFTPWPICAFMSSMFSKIEGEVELLDPGCGVGGLFTSFIEEAKRRNSESNINITGFELDRSLSKFLIDAQNICTTEYGHSSVQIHYKDFIIDDVQGGFSHVIMNPPYKKIASKSEYRKRLRENGIETGNLYSGFLAKAIKQTKKGGEIVAIIPRSFMNGLYFFRFREFLLKETSIKQIHLFDQRNSAFSEDQVLQENVIIHLVKGEAQSQVKVTTSPSGDFYRDNESNSIISEGLTIRNVPFEKVVNPNDSQSFIHVASSEYQQRIIDRLSIFNSTLQDLDVEVSTGPVVDFRLKNDLKMNPTKDSNPLIYPQHLNGGVNWPIKSKKPNAIVLSEKSKPYLWENNGCFVLVRRFSSKEEKRRIFATIYDSKIKGELVGFENKLNVFHTNKKGLDLELAKGLSLYLNCSLVDQYYRMFSGNTQVNATDLRALHYPDKNLLVQIGKRLDKKAPNQEEIDLVIKDLIQNMTNIKSSDPLDAQQKIDQAIIILRELGMPSAQQNERSALTLLALLNLSPSDEWTKSENPMMGVTPIMDWVREEYGKEYAPNTRETFRRQTLHQFVEGGLVAYNPDKPDRPPNSPKSCYQVLHELKILLHSYGGKNWNRNLKEFLSKKNTLVAQYAMAREMSKVPLQVNEDEEFYLTPGDHSRLIKKIIEEFGPQFVPGAELIYVGDTENKTGYYLKERLKELGVIINDKGKLPDVMLYYGKKNWLLLIESVTSHGPVDGKRYQELKSLFESSNADLVYVTAFLNRKAMAKYIADISWESEVWVAEAPTHMIHFNGHKFLGPFKSSN